VLYVFFKGRTLFPQHDLPYLSYIVSQFIYPLKPLGL